MIATAYDRVLDALHAAGMKVKESAGGGKARAQCPVHGSRGLTLSLRRADDKAQLRCFADCDYDDVLAALGLTRREMFDGDLPASYTPPPRRQPADPWTEVIVHNGPGVDHLLHRIAVEHALEADPGLRERARAQGDDCAACREVAG